MMISIFHHPQRQQPVSAASRQSDEAQLPQLHSFLALINYLHHQIPQHSPHFYSRKTPHEYPSSKLISTQRYAYGYHHQQSPSIKYSSLQQHNRLLVPYSPRHAPLRLSRSTIGMVLSTLFETYDHFQQQHRNSRCITFRLHHPLHASSNP